MAILFALTATGATVAATAAVATTRALLAAIVG
jgi:hypothetical protein